jgi:proteasome accessory factor C
MAGGGAEARLQRILAMVPWITAHGDPTVAEVCERYDLTPAQLAADLELLYLCGLHPYTPELLIEATIEDGRVRIGYADYFSRPLRLTPQEGLSLLASASALLGAPGSDQDGPLARGLAKLAATLGAEEVLDVNLGDADATVVAMLRDAIAQGTQVEIDYWSHARAARTERTIEPDALFSIGGQHYVSAWCHLAADERIFRLDRILTARPTAAMRTHPRSDQAPVLFARRNESGTAVIDLAPQGRWVIEQYPFDTAAERPDGSLRVQLQVSEWAWLDRLLLRLGDAARVIQGPAGWPGTAPAAQKILARYRRTDTTREGATA